MFAIILLFKGKPKANPFSLYLTLPNQTESLTKQSETGYKSQTKIAKSVFASQSFRAEKNRGKPKNTKGEK